MASAVSAISERPKGAYPSTDLLLKFSQGDPSPQDSALPLEIATASGSKYKLFIAPLEPDKLTVFCFKKKWGGDTFCLKKNCTITSHLTKQPFSVKPGDIFIEKQASLAFSRCFLNSKVLADEVLQDWSNSFHSIDEWQDLFAYASSSLEQEDDESVAKN